MAYRFLISALLLTPIMLFGQKSADTKAVKIEFLQSLNKLETAFLKDRPNVEQYMTQLTELMDVEIKKNNSLTEKMMKMPQRTPEQRKTLQDQLARTAKQKYLQKSFSELDWQNPEMESQMALQVARNFMNMLE